MTRLTRYYVDNFDNTAQNGAFTPPKPYKLPSLGIFAYLVKIVNKSPVDRPRRRIVTTTDYIDYIDCIIE